MLAPRLLLMNFFSCPIFFGKSCLADLHSFTTRPFSSIIFSISKWMHHSSNPFSSKLFRCQTLSFKLALSLLNCLLCFSSSSFFCRSEEHTSELQSRFDLVCRLLLEQQK